MDTNSISCKTVAVSFVCESSGIRIVGLSHNLLALLHARIAISRIENDTLLISGIGTLETARRIYSFITTKHGIVVNVPDELRIDAAMQRVEEFLLKRIPESLALPSIAILISCIKMRWIDIDVKFRISSLLARLHAQQERGGGLGGYRILRVDKYNAIVDGLKSKDAQIARLLNEISVLDYRIQNQTHSKDAFVSNC